MLIKEITKNKEQLTFTSTVVFLLVLVPGSVQLTYKKYLVLTYLGKIYITEVISQSLAEKKIDKEEKVNNQ